MRKARLVLATSDGHNLLNFRRELRDGNQQIRKRLSQRELREITDSKLFFDGGNRTHLNVEPAAVEGFLGYSNCSHSRVGIADPGKSLAGSEVEAKA